jgi:hypothetical protein
VRGGLESTAEMPWPPTVVRAAEHEDHEGHEETTNSSIRKDSVLSSKRIFFVFFASFVFVFYL